MRFGSWTVKSFSHTAGRGCAFWNCVCICGTERAVRAHSLMNDGSKGCSMKCSKGCVRPKNTRTPEKARIYKENFRAAHPGQQEAYHKMYQARWREANPELHKLRYRIANFRSKYSMEISEVEALLQSQGGRCGICSNEIAIFSGPNGANIDHDHVADKVRGLLCGNCNKGLGYFQDCVAAMRQAIVYLDRTPITLPPLKGLRTGPKKPTMNRAEYLQMSRRHSIRHNYGIEIDRVEQLFAEQNGKCLICNADIVLGGNGKKSAHIDHCHKTKGFRGILCSNCNTGLGQFHDDPALLTAAITYLQCKM